MVATHGYCRYSRLVATLLILTLDKPRPPTPWFSAPCTRSICSSLIAFVASPRCHRWHSHSLVLLMLHPSSPSAASFRTGVFQCTADKDVLTAAQRFESRRANADPCEGLDQSACDAKDECTWCKSAAVPSSCYTRVRNGITDIDCHCCVTHAASYRF